MPTNAPSPLQKALIINENPAYYGTFAEIGGGQEVARHFFQAGRASQTIAKTMSAYDMTFSDSIYGKTQRYVSEVRLRKMLDHEYNLIEKRLKSDHGAHRCFFAFANTVAVYAGDKLSQGWMGIRFQSTPQAPANQIILQVQLKDRDRLRQQEALGLLGVNLVYGAFQKAQNITEFLDSLKDHLGSRIEISWIGTEGPLFKDVDPQKVALTLVNNKIAPAALFSTNGRPLPPTECLFERPILVQRGTFRPVTKVNMEIIEHGLKQFKSIKDVSDPFVLMEISLTPEDRMTDIQHRIETLGALGYYTLITEFNFDYQLKEFLRQHTNSYIGMVSGASYLERLFNENQYQLRDNNLLGMFGQLFDNKTFLYIYPYKSEDLCSTASTFNPQPSLAPLYKYLLTNNFIQDIAGCDKIDTSIHSSNVRELLVQQDDRWEDLVPKSTRDLIKRKGLFSDS